MSGIEGGPFGVVEPNAGAVSGSDVGAGQRSAEGASAIVTVRGTGEGLVVRLDGRVAQESLLGAVKDFVAAREQFLKGQDVALEWVGAKPAESLVAEVSHLLFAEFSIKVRASRLRESKRVEASREVDMAAARKAGSRSHDSGKSASLFDGMESVGLGAVGISDVVFDDDDINVSRGTEDRVNPAAEAFLFDEPDARIIYATLRSGQKIETEHSLIVFGDVNSGAEIVAGGDVVVMGTLRGVAHAGAYDETGGGRFIFAMSLKPTQLRIGSVISRGSPEGGKVPEVARVDGNNIVVETYQVRSAAARRRM